MAKERDLAVHLLVRTSQIASVTLILLYECCDDYYDDLSSRLEFLEANFEGV